MSGTRQKPVRSPGRRAICPHCGRNTAVTAVSFDWDGCYWRLRPHGNGPGGPCKGYRVPDDALVPV